MEKRVPKNLRECYQEDDVSAAIWGWASFLRKCGLVLAIVMVVFGFIYALVSGSTAYEEASGDTEALAFLLAFGGAWAMWIFAAVVEYLSFSTVALLLEALASLVQHTKINADVTLYRAAKAENYVESKELTSLAPTTMTATPTSAPPAPTPVTVTPKTVTLMQSNFQEYLQLDVCYDNVREALSPKRETARYADVRVMVTPKQGVRFEKTSMELTVHFGDGYKAFDDVYEDYIYPKANYVVSLSSDGVGTTEPTTVMTLLQNGQPVLSKEAEVTVVSATGVVYHHPSTAHKWRCSCGNMIDTEYCPHCGTKTE